jgi:NAD(P)-dependent dehydrogenase (short-subunit alcohol dehydrogenase family)
MDENTFESLLDLSGRTAVITGGTRGIGPATAEGFVLSGANVVVASRKADACAETASHLIDLGGQALGVPTHTGDIGSLDALVAATVDRFGGIDVVVNNAANGLGQPVGAQTPEAWQKSFEVNLRGPVMLTQAALPHLERSEHASVINVASVGAVLFAAERSIYAAMKAALVSFTRSAAAELGPRGIRVNALAPGAVDTYMTRKIGPDAAQKMSTGTILRRPAVPDEMVGPMLFLASDAASYMTGQVLLVDGGLHPL